MRPVLSLIWPPLRLWRSQPDSPFWSGPLQGRTVSPDRRQLQVSCLSYLDNGLCESG